MLHIIVGIFGCLLIINSILIMASDKYLSFLSKSFLIEPASNSQKEKVRSFVKKNTEEDRYVISFICLGLGLVAILWSFGIIKSVTFPFFILVVFIVSIRVFRWKMAKKLKSN
jgi:hypothetical protein